MPIDTNPPNHGDTLDCGHVLHVPDATRATGTGASGYARTNEGRTLCYACAHDRAVADLLTSDRMVAYLNVPKHGVRDGGSTLTDWPGGTLARVTYLTRGRHNIGGYLYRFTAIDVHGQHWYGTSPGPGMYARMRKAKRQPHV